MEGSKFVEMASVDNVKRTWVNYGGAREWSDPTQGQVGGGGGEEGKGGPMSKECANRSKELLSFHSNNCQHSHCTAAGDTGQVAEKVQILH